MSQAVLLIMVANDVCRIQTLPKNANSRGNRWRARNK